ncbi:hypothetical protein I633_22246 (plasmid) [Alteromonas mediterranea 615]|uniref:Uncharacterized protein n=1 Tax=Alteromonas mediterranea 615 TaxID=1300253 RepID=S5AIB1_9ALTE|nr:hypothetical protein I633_22246 [Alteromonas mediterranea 615]
MCCINNVKILLIIQSLRCQILEKSTSLEVYTAQLAVDIHRTSEKNGKARPVWTQKPYSMALYCY